MNFHRNRFCPHLESLEGRDTPSNLTVTFANHTLTVKGDPAANSTLTIEGNVSDPTQFTISSSSSDTFNGSSSPFSSKTGVQSFSFVLGGNETVNFDDSVCAIDLEGNLSFNGGNGDNEFGAELLTVGKNLTITNGTNSGAFTGPELNFFPSATFLSDLNVGGNVTITNGAGSFFTGISRDVPGSSTIGGNLSITNGTGYRENEIQDTNIDGNVTVSNGHAGSNGNAGSTEISNTQNTTRSIIGGNLSISYLTGSGLNFNDQIFDTDVKGNVTINHGTGNFTTDFDGLNTSVPVEIGGSLTMTGSGINTINVGTTDQKTGLIVAKNLSISGGPDPLYFNNLTVGGTTSLTLGTGIHELIIDDSVFNGAFTAKIGSGESVVEIDSNIADTYSTLFNRAVDITLTGSGNIGFLATSNQYLVVMSTFVVNNANVDNWTQNTSLEDFPNGNSIDLR